jgi:hypothetical protein
VCTGIPAGDKRGYLLCTGIPAGDKRGYLLCTSLGRYLIVEKEDAYLLCTRLGRYLLGGKGRCLSVVYYGSTREKYF